MKHKRNRDYNRYVPDDQEREWDGIDMATIIADDAPKTKKKSEITKLNQIFESLEKPQP